MNTKMSSRKCLLISKFYPFKFLSLLILSCFFSCSSDDSPQNDFLPANFKGTKGYLKSMKWTGVNKGQEIPNSNTYYNYEGNKLLEKRIYSPNNQEIYYNYVYNYEAEKIMKRTISNSNNFLSVTNYNYDSQNRLIEQIFDNTKYQYIYENNDILWKTFKLDANNVFQPYSESFITIDAHNQILNFRETTNNTITTFWGYDDKVSPMRGIVGFNKILDNTIEEIAYNNFTNENNTSTIQYEYNSENKPTKAICTKDNAVYLIVNYAYY
ncbi:MAG: hypothetical protein H7221_05325 [Flavobacterium sp.]|nr:hypothetical protein [Flavobacterium sp.]